MHNCVMVLVLDVRMAAGCFIMNFLVVGGAAKSFGILYVEFVDKYGTSSSGTLAIVALSQSLCMLLGQCVTELSMGWVDPWVGLSLSRVGSRSFSFRWVGSTTAQVGLLKI